MDGTITIYADVLFFINFSIDFLCLYITGKILCVPVKALKTVAASALGGLYSCLAIYLSGLKWYLSLPLHAASAALMCLIAFGRKSIAARTAVFVISCGLTGGLMCAAYAVMGKGFYVGGGFYVDADPLFVLIFAAAASVSSLFYLLLCRRRKSCGDVKILFSFQGKSFSANLLCDSGCFLRDSLSGNPVIIVSKDILKGEIKISGADEASLTALGKTARLIPIRTVSGTSVLAAFRPDALTVINGGSKKAVPAVIAVDCAETSYGGFDGIIPAEII